MFDKQYENIRISEHAYERAEERLREEWRNDEEGDPAFKNWIIRRVRRAQQQQSLSEAPPAWADYRVASGKKQRWATGVCDGLRYGILVTKKKYTLLVVTVITYDPKPKVPSW